MPSIHGPDDKKKMVIYPVKQCFSSKCFMGDQFRLADNTNIELDGSHDE